MSFDHLLSGQERSGTEMNLREGGLDPADRLGCGLRAEGHLHGIETSVEECLGEWFCIFGPVDGDDRDDAFGKGGCEIKGKHLSTPRQAWFNIQASSVFGMSGFLKG